MGKGRATFLHFITGLVIGYSRLPSYAYLNEFELATFVEVGACPVAATSLNGAFCDEDSCHKIFFAVGVVLTR